MSKTIYRIKNKQSVHTDSKHVTKNDLFKIRNAIDNTENEMKIKVQMQKGI